MNQIKQIKEFLNGVPVEELPKALEGLRGDRRPGVIKLISSYENKYNKHIHEQNRLSQMMIFENKYYNQNFQTIAGIDEAGRGPLAGPVCVAAVVLPKKCAIEKANDSKKLSPKIRACLYDEIMERALAVSVKFIGHQMIDEINILQATLKGAKEAVDGLQVQPQVLLTDALRVPGISVPQEAITAGDTKSISIACASILAKVSRDRVMDEMDERYPQYGFKKHKGYGTKEHIEAIRKFGLCPIHRLTFVKNFYTYN